MKRFACTLAIAASVAFFMVQARPQDNPDTPDTPELERDANATVSRQKRQFGCPVGCYSSCSNTAQCQMYSMQAVCVQGCCCSSNSLDTACSGGPAVAACIGGLCGQGYFCSSNNYCCRCSSGNSTGPCVNRQCPTGFLCNTNDYCCPLGSGGVLGVCVNGACPTGYTCGAGNLCYATSG